MPLGVAVSKAGANDGCQAEELLKGMVVQPPAPEVPNPQPDVRDLPRGIGDGAYGDRPTQERGRRAGFRVQAPRRGQRRAGLGKVRNAVERCHNFFAQFGRAFRRFDRSAKRYLAWLEMAACVILLRSGFVS
jgi:transposase